MIDLVYDNFGHLLINMNQPWLARHQLNEFVDTIHNVRAPLENCWSFIDGTVRPCSRPGQNHQILLIGVYHFS